MWPFRRRSAEPALPVVRADWRTLPPLQRVVAPHPLINPVSSFTSTLSSWQNPSFLAPLAHAVGAGEPSGSISDVAVPSAREWKPPSEGVVVSRMVSVPEADAGPSVVEPSPLAVVETSPGVAPAVEVSPGVVPAVQRSAVEEPPRSAPEPRPRRLGLGEPISSVLQRSVGGEVRSGGSAVRPSGPAVVQRDVGPDMSGGTGPVVAGESADAVVMPLAGSGEPVGSGAPADSDAAVVAPLVGPGVPGGLEAQADSGVGAVSADPVKPLVGADAPAVQRAADMSGLPESRSPAAPSVQRFATNQGPRTPGLGLPIVRQPSEPGPAQSAPSRSVGEPSSSDPVAGFAEPSRVVDVGEVSADVVQRSEAGEPGGSTPIAVLGAGGESVGSHVVQRVVARDSGGVAAGPRADVVQRSVVAEQGSSAPVVDAGRVAAGGESAPIAGFAEQLPVLDVGDSSASTAEPSLPRAADIGRDVVQRSVAGPPIAASAQQPSQDHAVRMVQRASTTVAPQGNADRARATEPPTAQRLVGDAPALTVLTRPDSPATPVPTAAETASVAQRSVGTAPALPTSTPALAPTAPVLPSTAPVVAGTTPVLAQTAPVLAQAAPVLPSTVPVVARTTPVLAQTAPVLPPTVTVVAQTVPALPRTAPVLAQAAHVLPPTAPVLAQAAPVPTRSAPVLPRAEPVVQRIPAAQPQAPPVVVQPAPEPTVVVARTPDPEPVRHTQEAPVVQRSEAPQPVASPGQNADELLRKLYDPLLRRLKADLWLDRERRGALTDL